MYDEVSGESYKGGEGTYYFAYCVDGPGEGEEDACHVCRQEVESESGQYFGCTRVTATSAEVPGWSGVETGKERVHMEVTRSPHPSLGPGSPPQSGRATPA